MDFILAEQDKQDWSVHFFLNKRIKIDVQLLSNKWSLLLQLYVRK